MLMLVLIQIILLIRANRAVPSFFPTGVTPRRASHNLSKRDPKIPSFFTAVAPPSIISTTHHQSTQNRHILHTSCQGPSSYQMAVLQEGVGGFQQGKREPLLEKWRDNPPFNNPPPTTTKTTPPPTKPAKRTTTERIRMENSFHHHHQRRRRKRC